MALAGTRFPLNTGAEIPAIGFATWEDCLACQEHLVTEALKVGYRHIESAQVYESEAAIGRALYKSKIPREELFITTKLWNNDHDPKDVGPALERSLQHLALDYVDLFLMHWPCPFAQGRDRFPLDERGRIIPGTTDFVNTYRAMETTMYCGKAKAIGISNFSRKELERLLANCTILPAVHRIELHPWLQQPEFVDFHTDMNIHILTCSPFGFVIDLSSREQSVHRLIQDEVIILIAHKYNKTPAQVALAWGINNGHSVLPKCLNSLRLQSNLEGDFGLDDEDMESLGGMDQKIRLDDPSLRYGWNLFDGDDGKNDIHFIPSSASRPLSGSSVSNQTSSLSIGSRGIEFSSLDETSVDSPLPQTLPQHMIKPFYLPFELPL